MAVSRLLRTPLSFTLGVEHALIQAPMLGCTTTDMVAAVSNAGGLGCLPASHLKPEEIRKAIVEIREKTDKPFGVNLFIDDPCVSETAERVRLAHTSTSHSRTALGLVEDPAQLRKHAPGQFQDQWPVLLDMMVPVFTFTFGVPYDHIVAGFRESGIKVIGTATTVKEAYALQSIGVDAICAQGAEAGGHRGTWLSSFEKSSVGLMALLPQMCDALTVPIIAAGGIMDGRGAAAARVLGAEGVQMGTAFIPCKESAASPAYKKAVLGARDDGTVVTCAYSGKPARGIFNKHINQMQGGDRINTSQYKVDTERVGVHVLEYPLQRDVTKGIRETAEKKQNPEFMQMWCGQGAGLNARRGVNPELSSADVVKSVVEYSQWPQ